MPRGTWATAPDGKTLPERIYLERDVGSLEDELRKGYPKRWHVAHDVLDMQKEIQRWRRLHETLWHG
jgi:hypothetical protein